MKRILFSFITLLSMFLCTIFNLSAETITVTLKERPGTGKHDPSPKGHRLPPMPIQCFIDTDLKTIYYSLDLEDIISYEIWNEDETMIMGIYNNQEEFVDALIDINANLTIIIETGNQTYIGYLYI